MEVKRGQPAAEAPVRGFGNDAPPDFMTRRARTGQEPAAAPAEPVRRVSRSEGEQIAAHLEEQAHHEPQMQSGAAHAEHQPRSPFEGVPITAAQALQFVSENLGFVPVAEPKPSAIRTYAASFGRIALATAAISAATAGVGIAIGEGAHIMTIPAFAGASAALFAQPLRAIGQGIINVVKRPFQKMAEARAERQAAKAERQERAEPTMARGRREEIHEEPHFGDLDAAVAAHRSEPPSAEPPEARVARASEEPAVAPTLTEDGPSRNARARVLDD